MKPGRIFEVYEQKGRIFTKNLVPGMQVYDERLFSDNEGEYREWNFRKSKLGAAIAKGCPNIFIRKNDAVLYLGASTGTTASHVSDIVGSEGFVFAIEFAPRVLRDLVFVCEKRKNIAPILGDAFKPESYVSRVSLADIVYQDIAQKNQVEIFKKNIALFLKDDGYAILAVKARSIDVTRRPTAIFNEVRAELEKDFKIIDSRDLEPFEVDHML